MSMMQSELFNPPRTPSRWRPPATLPDLRGVRRLSLDTEYRPGSKFDVKPVGISARCDDGRKFYLPFAHAGGGNLDEAQVKRWARSELRDKDLTCLNAGGDVQCLLNWGVDLEAQGCRPHDIAFGAALLNEYRYSGFSLGALGKEYVGREKLDVEAGRIADMHSADVGPYAEEDAVLTWDIGEVIRPMIEHEDLERVLSLEDSLIYVVNEMERNAARIDVPKLERWITETAAEVERLTLDIWRATGKRVSPDSALDMAELFKILKLPYGVTANGQMSVTAEFLRRIPDPIVQKCLRIRRLNSLRSKYLLKYRRSLQKGDVIRFVLHQLRGDEYGTVTGRFSGSGGRDGKGFNPQQVMKVEKQIEEFGPDYIIRELFIPDEGYDWFSADASQIEFRIFAHYSGSESLIRRYREDPDVDFHELTREMIARRRPCTRRLAKVGNFGTIYGMGLAAAAAQLGMDDADARDFLDDYHGAFPEAKRLMNMAMRLAQKRGWVKTILGRRGRFPQKERYHAALNKVIQGSAADVNKLKLLEMYRERKTVMIHKLRLTVHDEMDGDLQRDPVARTRLKEMLDTQAIEFKVPILWDTEVGPNWKECA